MAVLSSLGRMVLNFLAVALTAGAAGFLVKAGLPSAPITGFDSPADPEALRTGLVVAAVCLAVGLPLAWFAKETWRKRTTASAFIGVVFGALIAYGVWGGSFGGLGGALYHRGWPGLQQEAESLAVWVGYFTPVCLLAYVILLFKTRKRRPA